MTVKKIVISIIDIMFAVLMLLIAIATIILDKNVNNAFPNTVIYQNSIYYLGAILIIGIILLFYRFIFSKSDIGNKSYISIMLIIPLLVLVLWQIPVGRWIYWYTNAGDFGNLMYAAIGFNNGATFVDFPYFFQSPNNANLAILLSWIYKIIPDWRKIVILGAILTNISAVLVSLTVKNYTKSKIASLVTLFISEILLAMTWRSFIVYTDNFGMIFVALIFFVYSLEMDDRYKMTIVVLFATIGTFIKITIFICFLAIIVHRLCSVYRETICKKKVKEMIFSCCFAILMFFLMFEGQSLLRSYHNLELEKQYPKGWQYMFMVGQNSEFLGVVNSEDGKFRDVLIEEAMNGDYDVDYVNQEFLAEAVDRIRSRGIWGNMLFYTKKLNVAYNDGYFHNVQETNRANISNELEHNIFYDLLEKENGKYYQISAGVLQIVWDSVLILLMLSVFLMRKNERFKVYEILILGVTFYLMLVEGRSKYLYMFLPAYIIAAGMVFSDVVKRLIKSKNVT